MGRQKWTDDHFGKQVKAQRERRGWSQAQMARMLVRRGIQPMHSTTLAKMELGDRSVRLNEAVTISDLFDVDLDHLLGRDKPDDSTVEYALVCLNGYASDALEAVNKAWSLVVDIQDQLESIFETFHVSNLNELEKAANDLGGLLKAANASAKYLASHAMDGLLDTDVTPPSEESR